MAARIGTAGEIILSLVIIFICILAIIIGSMWTSAGVGSSTTGSSFILLGSAQDAHAYRPILRGEFNDTSGTM